MAEAGRDLYDAVAQMQLPTSLGSDEAVTLAVAHAGSSLEPDEEALAARLRLDLESWVDGASPSALLKALVAAGLQAGGSGSLDAKAYFDTYSRLVKGTSDAAALSHSVAVRLLSRSNLIERLLEDERMSATQVTKQLQATERSLRINVRAVQMVANAVYRKPTLDANNAGPALWSEDKARAEELFPDSDLEQSCRIAGERLHAWYPDEDVAPLLIALSADASGDDGWPYLQLAHWCATVLEFFDHPASYLYEFSPRGAVAESLFALYPAATGNPVLNNAKAVASLDASWAHNRGSTAGHALSELLLLLESVPAVARRHMARVIRAWLFRVLELNASEPNLIGQVDASAARDLISLVASEGTGTSGVIEQRVADAMSVLTYPAPRWRARGLGQGVNDTNLSRKKLGDVEFTDAQGRHAIAIEVHGGILTSPYIEGHLKSMARVLQMRLNDSWLSIDDASQWRLDLVFVAHELAPGLRDQELIMFEVPVRVTSKTMRDYFDHAAENVSDAELTEAFNTYVIEVLNGRNVRESARDAMRALLAK